MKGKEGLFFLDQKLAQNMINSEHVIVQWVVSSFFPFTLNFNNLCPISVRGALASWFVRSSPYADFTIPSNRTAVFQGCRNYVTNISGNFEEMIVQGTCRKEKSTTHKRLIRAEWCRLSASALLLHQINKLTWACDPFESSSWAVANFKIIIIKKRDFDDYWTWARDVQFNSFFFNSIFI